MPSTYGYRCKNGHYWELSRSWADYRPTAKCPECRSRGKREYAPAFVAGPFTDQTRELLSVPFGRKKAMKFQRASDVDAALRDFERRYKHFGLEPSHPDKDFT